MSIQDISQTRTWNGNFYPYEEFIQDVYQTLDQIGGIGSGHRFYGIGRDICRSRGIFIFFARLPVLDHMAEECLLTHSDDPKNNQNLELRYTRLSLLTGGSSTSNSRRVTISTPITSRQPSSDLDWRRSWSWGRSWWWDHSCWWDQSYWDWYGWNQNYWDQSYWDQNYWWDRRYWGASTRANGQNQNSNQISRTRTTGTSTCEIRFRIN